MQIISKAEATAQSTHSVLIYGDPGTGKTSFATSTPNPLLLPFDKAGALRAIGNPDLVQLTNWQDALEFASQPIGTFANYDTVVIDTVGKLLDEAEDYVKVANPAVNVQRGSNALSMKGYGALKSEFQTWFRKLLSHELNIVLIAHAKESSDDTVRPDIVGGSQAIVLQEVDAVAYVHISNDGHRVADFAPRATAVGKDCANLGTYAIADLPTGDFEALGTMQHVINAIRDAIANNIEATAAAKAVFLDVKKRITSAINDSDNLVGAYNAAVAARDEAQSRDASVSEQALLNKQVASQVTDSLNNQRLTTDLEGYNYLLESILQDELLQKDKPLKAALLAAAKNSGFEFNPTSKLFV